MPSDLIKNMLGKLGLGTLSCVLIASPSWSKGWIEHEGKLTCKVHVERVQTFTDGGLISGDDKNDALQVGDRVTFQYSLTGNAEQGHWLQIGLYEGTTMLFGVEDEITDNMEFRFFPKWDSFSVDYDHFFMPAFDVYAHLGPETIIIRHSDGVLNLNKNDEGSWIAAYTETGSYRPKGEKPEIRVNVTALICESPDGADGVIHMGKALSEVAE